MPRMSFHEIAGSRMLKLRPGKSVRPPQRPGFRSTLAAAGSTLRCMMGKSRVIVVGGGAAGFFGAITAAELLGAGAEVTIYEATAHPLAKVRVSGGGRCNVTHACFDPRELARRYPRGGRELLGAFHRWQPRDMIAWLAAHDVETKVEEDGRVFPVSDDSATVVECLRRAAENGGVRVITSTALTHVSRADRPAKGQVDDSAPRPGRSGFTVTLSSGASEECDHLLLATGGNRASAGYAAAQSLGHTIEPLVPSLFTFNVEDSRLAGLAGVSVENVIASVCGTKLRETGALLVTHWGVSGPAILKLSAWGARELAARDYRFTLALNFAAPHTRDSLARAFALVREKNPRKQIGTWSPLALPQRLWERLVAAAGIAPATPWTNLGNAVLDMLAARLVAAEFAVTGKSPFKDEFVTCGGVRLSEVDFRTMESRVCPGLYLAGEILDIDGVTGGFNFQAAWTTSRLAGSAIAGGGPG